MKIKDLEDILAKIPCRDSADLEFDFDKIKVAYPMRLSEETEAKLLFNGWKKGEGYFYQYA